MKKLVVFSVLLALLFVHGTCFADEIVFRGIPWGSAADYTCDELNKNGLSLYLSSVDEYRSKAATYRLRNMIAPMLYGNASIGEQGLTTIALAYPRDVKVAGYNLSSVMTFFVYKPHEGELVYNDKYTAFYAGVYSFVPENIDGMYNDLKEKLSSVYGEYSVEGNQDIIVDLFGEKEFTWSSVEPKQRMTVWETAESYLYLVSNNMPDDADPLFYSDSVVIVYAAKQSDTWIDEAMLAQKRTNERLEKEKYGDGNIEGL